MSNDSALFAAQIETHRGYLARLARQQLRDAAEIEDVVQETLIAAWQGRAAFRGQAALRTWLVGILHHKVIDLIRSRQRHPLVAYDDAALRGNDGEGEGDVAGVRAAGSAAWAEGVEVAWERRRRCEEVLAALEEHSPQAAQIFVLREIEGEDTPAICRRLQVSSANCYVLLHRARQFLNERFGPLPHAA